MLYARAEAEGTRRRNPYDTIVEGIGLNRLTANFAAALVDDAVRGSDQEAVLMVRPCRSPCSLLTLTHFEPCCLCAYSAVLEVCALHMPALKPLRLIPCFGDVAEY